MCRPVFRVFYKLFFYCYVVLTEQFHYKDDKKSISSKSVAQNTKEAWIGCVILIIFDLQSF